MVIRGEFEPIFGGEKGDGFNGLAFIIGKIDAEVVFVGAEQDNLVDFEVFEQKNRLFVPLSERFESAKLGDEVEVDIGEVAKG